jgi:integrase/recombinase XerD
MRAEYLSAFEAHLEANTSPATVRAYGRIVARFASLLAPRDIADVELADVERFVARPRRTGGAATTSTRNLEVVALRALFAVVTPREGDPTRTMVLRRASRRDPSVPTATELRMLFETAARSPGAARDLAMLALLFQAGLRVHELVALTVDQLDLAGKTIVGLRGKGDTRRDHPLGEEAASLLLAWLDQRGRDAGPLFPCTSTAGSSVRSVQRLLARLRRHAGIAKRLTPHSLRHATATMSIARGTDLPTTAALMRHSRVETTMLYVALASEARRDAANKLGGARGRQART